MSSPGNRKIVDRVEESQIDRFVNFLTESRVRKLNWARLKNDCPLRIIVSSTFSAFCAFVTE